jgi:uncharacterized membrane protein YfcA
LSPEIIALIAVLVLAFLYSSVGHGGASAYLAIMTILSFPIELIRPSALLMNLFVAGIAFIQYYRSGHFKWHLFWPFALASIPMAFLGAQIDLDPDIYKKVLGALLLIAVLPMFGIFRKGGGTVARVSILPALIAGAAVGYLSGIIGIGGGIILSPLLLLLRWADIKTAAAVSAAFIWVNSASGLIGLMNADATLHSDIWTWVAVALVGGLFGAYFGSRRLNNKQLRGILGGVLLLAGLKLIFT